MWGNVYGMEKRVGVWERCVDVWGCEGRCEGCGKMSRKVWGNVLGCGRGEERCKQRYEDVGEVQEESGNVEKGVWKFVGVWKR